MSTDLKHHQCERSESWLEYDARGIYLCRVCELCIDAKLAGYRYEVLDNPNYSHDELIDEDE